MWTSLMWHQLLTVTSSMLLIILSNSWCLLWKNIAPVKRIRNDIIIISIHVFGVISYNVAKIVSYWSRVWYWLWYLGFLRSSLSQRFLQWFDSWWIYWTSGLWETMNVSGTKQTWSYARAHYKSGDISECFCFAIKI